MKNKVIVPVRSELFLSILRGETILAPGQLPPTCELVAVHYNHAFQCFDLIVADESFPPTATGACLRRVDVTFITP